MTMNRMLRSKRPLGMLGAALGTALVLAGALPATALERPADEQGAVAAPMRTADAPTFTPDLQTEIHIGDEVQPTDFVASADGKWGYVVSRDLSEFVVIDLATREVDDRIAIPSVGGDYIRLSADGTRAYFSAEGEYWSVGVGVVDLTTGSYLETLDSVPPNIQEIVVSADGSTLYLLGLAGEVTRVDTATGTELARTALPQQNFYGLALIDDESTLLVGQGNTVYKLDPVTLAQLESFTVAGVNAIASFAIDTADERVYFADTQGSKLGVFNPATGELTSLIGVGNLMHDVVGFDDLNRSFGNVPYWGYLMAADHGTGKRSESVRSMPNAPFSIAKNPVTRDLLSANAGWRNAEKGSTVSVVNAPRVTDPADAAVTAPGETVRFETEAVGIKRGYGGGVVWQSSVDGETWVDIEGESFEQLDVVATPEAVKSQYRVRFYDDFWGQHGASAAARINAPGPKITFDGPLADGTVDEEYPATAITATGQDDLAWGLAEEADVAVSGFPDGMTLNAADGTLSGTPTAAGTYTFTARVTDAFGEDARTYTLVVKAKQDPAGPTDPAVPPTDPTDPDGPADTGDRGGDDLLSKTGGMSPLYLGLIAADAIAAGGAGIVFARRRAGGPTE